MIHLLTEAKVRVITFARYTTQIFQVLDLTPFGIFKRSSRHELPYENDKKALKIIMKVYHDCGQTVVPPTVWGAFHALGLDFDMRSEPYRLVFDENKLRESEGFQELWSIDFPWTGCRASDVLLSSVGSTHRTKMI
jgi:hypothetical protein